MIHIKDFLYLKVDLTFSPDALKGISQLAMERKTGARGLRAIMVSIESTCILKISVLTMCHFLQETLLLEPMFEIPGSDVLSVHITDDSVLKKAEPVYIRGKQVDSTEAAEDDSSEMQARAEVK